MLKFSSEIGKKHVIFKLIKEANLQVRYHRSIYLIMTQYFLNRNLLFLKKFLKIIKNIIANVNA